MPKATPDDIIVYIYEKGPVRAKDLEQEFVKTKRVSRGTLYKYKKLLEADGKIKATLVYARPPYFTYHVPPKHHPEVEVLKQYRSLSESLFLNTKEVAWEDTPLGFYLTNVKQKVLWSDA